MFVAIVLLAGLVLCLAFRDRPRRMGHADKLGLESYEHKARCEGAFPFDYLSR